MWSIYHQTGTLNGLPQMYIYLQKILLLLPGRLRLNIDFQGPSILKGTYLSTLWLIRKKIVIAINDTVHLTHWGQVTHICVSKLTVIGSDNGVSPGRHQAIIWTNAGILSIGPLGTNFNEI